MKNIYPSIIFSEKKDVTGFSDSCKLFLNSEDSKVFENYFQFVEIENNSISVSGNNEIKIEISGTESKKDIYSSYQKNRANFVNLFNELISGPDGFFSLANKNNATNLNYNLIDPNIIFVFDASSSNLTPSLFTLLLNFSELLLKPNLHVVIDYCSQNIDEDYRSKCVANFRELDKFISDNDQIGASQMSVWLLDDVNEKQQNVGGDNNKNLAISKFIKILYEDHNSIVRGHYRWSNEKGRKCFLSSIGLSSINIPLKNISTLLNNYAIHVELNEIKEKNEKTKHDRLRIKQDIESFYRDNDYRGISHRLYQYEGVDIFSPILLDFNKYSTSEKEICLEEILSIIDDPKVRSSALTIKLNSLVDQELESYKNKELVTIYEKLERSKQTTESDLLKMFDEQTISIIDNPDKGLMYAWIFNNVIVDNEALVAEKLDGPLVDYLTLSDLELNIRKNLIGDKLDGFEKTSQKNSDIITNKNETLNNYKDKIEILKKEIDNIKGIENNNESNPKLIEKEQELKSLSHNIETITLEIDASEKAIIKSKKSIEELKNQYENNTYKEDLKRKMNPTIDSEKKEIKEKIDGIDTRISELYLKKNEMLHRRKKFIGKNLILIPSVVFLLLILFQTLLYTYTDWISLGNLFKYGGGITILILCLYYVKSFFQFFKMKNTLSKIIINAEQLINSKTFAFQELLNLENEFRKKDFIIDAEIRSLDILRKIKQKIKNKADSIRKFADVISEEAIKHEALVKEIKFETNDFDACVINREEVTAIYLKRNSFDISKGKENSFSSYYNDFLQSNELKSLIADIKISAEKIYLEDIVTIDLEEVLFNENELFPQQINTQAKFENLINTSQPLLVTESSAFERDIPQREKVFIGKTSNRLNKELQLHITDSINNVNIIHPEDDKSIGILSIKRNFPLAYASDILKWDLELSKSKVIVENLFISKDYFSHSYQLKKSNHEQNFKNISEDLIIALCEGLINYDENTKSFKNELLGDLGRGIDDLKRIWNSASVFDIKQQSKKILKEIERYDDKELSIYLQKVPKTAKLLDLKGQDRINFQEYFYSNQGTSDLWEENYIN